MKSLISTRYRLWYLDENSFIPILPCVLLPTPSPFQHLQVKGLLYLLEAVLGALDRVADSAGVGVDLIVVAALHGLVAEEVDGSVVDAARLLGLVFQVLQAVCLVPARGEYVERDLAADGEAAVDSYVSFL